jgi:hypothetical protein
VTNNPDPIHCSGTAAAPTAASGYLCVYEAFNNTFIEEGIVKSEVAPLGEGIFHASSFSSGADPFGFRLTFSVFGTVTENQPPLHFSNADVGGSWAVTG